VPARTFTFGAENFFLFGLTAEQVQQLQSRGYRPYDCYEQNAALREVLDFIGPGDANEDWPDERRLVPGRARAG